MRRSRRCGLGCLGCDGKLVRRRHPTMNEPSRTFGSTSVASNSPRAPILQAAYSWWRVSFDSEAIREETSMLDHQIEAIPQHAATSQLLRLHGLILAELRERKVVRSSNSPGGDYAEFLFARSFGWTLNGNSSSGYDAKDRSGTRFQIKCRRLTKHNSSRQLSALRQLPEKKFDFLAGVLFNEDYTVFRAAIIPHELLVGPHVRFSSHVNAHLFRLHDDVWKLRGVEDVTAQLRDAAEAL